MKQTNGHGLVHLENPPDIEREFDDSDPFSILGVSRNASELEIKRAYRELVERYHPDHNPDGLDMFLLVGRAYAVLKDPQAKKMFLEHGVFKTDTSKEKIKRLALREIESLFARVYEANCVKNGKPNMRAISITDMMGAVRDSLKASAKAAREKIAENEKTIQGFKEVMRRLSLKKKNKSSRVMLENIRAGFKAREDLLKEENETMRHNILVFTEAVPLVDYFEYEHEEPPEESMTLEEAFKSISMQNMPPGVFRW